MKRAKIMSMAAVAFAVSAISFSAVTPVSANNGYGNNSNNNWNNNQDNNWNHNQQYRHHDYSRYSRNQVMNMFHNRYPNAHVRYVQTYRFGNHIVYRIQCNNNNRYIYFDSYTGNWFNNHMRL